jgi:hypothetical protein
MVGMGRVLTKKQGLVGVPVDEAFDGRIGLLVERVQRQLGVVGDHARLERDELPRDGVVPWVVPVDPAQDVWAVKVSGAFLFCSFSRGVVGGPATHVIRTAMVAAVMPSKTSLINSSRDCVRVPDLSYGTSFRRVVSRNLNSWGFVSTIFLV